MIFFVLGWVGLRGMSRSSCANPRSGACKRDLSIDSLIRLVPAASVAPHVVQFACYAATDHAFCISSSKLEWTLSQRDLFYLPKRPPKPCRLKGT